MTWAALARCHHTSIWLSFERDNVTVSFETNFRFALSMYSIVIETADWSIEWIQALTAIVLPWGNCLLE